MIQPHIGKKEKHLIRIALNGQQVQLLVNIGRPTEKVDGAVHRPISYKHKSLYINHKNTKNIYKAMNGVHRLMPGFHGRHAHLVHPKQALVDALPKRQHEAALRI